MDPHVARVAVLVWAKNIQDTATRKVIILYGYVNDNHKKTSKREEYLQIKHAMGTLKARARTWYPDRIWSTR